MTRTLDTLPLLDESSHDANSYKLSIEAIMQRFELDPAKLIAFISDAAEVNYKTATIMGTDLQRCSAHLLSLLVKDLITVGHIFDVFDHCNGIQRVFAKSAIQNHHLKQNGASTKIASFSPTRWNHCFKLFQSVSANLDALQLFPVLQYTESSGAKETLKVLKVDFPFLKKCLPAAVLIVKEIDSRIHYISGRHCILGSIYHEMMDLQDYMRNTIQPLLVPGENICDIWARFKELLSDEYVIASAALNPQHALRILKRKKSSTVKTFHQPDLKDALPVFVKIFQKFGSIVAVENNPDPSSDESQSGDLLIKSASADAILKKKFK